MRQFTLLIVLQILASAVGCSKDQNPQGIYGTWKVTHAIFNGEAFNPDTDPNYHFGTRFEFSPKKLSISPRPELTEGIRRWQNKELNLKASMSPKRFTTQQKETMRDGTPWPPAEYIYEIKNDSLTLCWSITGDSLPQQFESLEGSNIGIYTLKRVPE